MKAPLHAFAAIAINCGPASTGLSSVLSCRIIRAPLTFLALKTHPPCARSRLGWRAGFESLLFPLLIANSRQSLSPRLYSPPRARGLAAELVSRFAPSGRAGPAKSVRAPLRPKAWWPRAVWFFQGGAGEGNRTLVISLEGCCFGINSAKTSEIHSCV